MADSFDRTLDWDDEISHDSEFTLLPEGDYDFTVVSFERGRHAGSAKLTPCNKAILTLRVTDGGETTTITHNLFLHSKTEGMVCSFFTAIGARKHGEKLRMDWNQVPGAKGRCKVYVDEWTGDDGQPRQSNKIKKFYEPAKATVSTPPPAVNPQPIGDGMF